MRNQLKGLVSHIRFRPEWMVIAYCYMVIFHLLPTVVLLPIVTVDPSTFDSAIRWFVFGIAAISVVVGYQSRKAAVLEVVLASLMYAGTLVIVLRWDLTTGWTHSGLTDEHHAALVKVLIASIGVTGAAVWGGALMWRVKRGWARKNNGIAH